MSMIIGSESHQVSHTFAAADIALAESQFDGLSDWSDDAFLAELTSSREGYAVNVGGSMGV